jgi:O-phosphoseryl-tRNA synthetase
VTFTVKFDVKKIKKDAERNFEKTWLETAKQLKLKGRTIKWRSEEKDLGHPVSNMAWKLRRTLLSLGLEELVNPTILEEAEVYKQYGPEAPVILDRCFYLAELPRPDLGLKKETLKAIEKIIPGFNEEQKKELHKIFRDYKEGEVEGDNLVEEMVNRLHVQTEQATATLSLFPELVKLKPKPTRLILRSHMTALWFPVLAKLQDKRPLPLELFSIGTKYRREQRLDPLHLYESQVASVALMAEDLTLEDGKELTEKVLTELGFSGVKFEVKKATSKYYAPGTEMEVFIKSGKQWIELGDLGFYSPVALANYGIQYPVFNVGFGVERITMILQGQEDIRKLVFPQFYGEVDYTDQEIAAMISLNRVPSTEEGQSLMNAIIQTALSHAEDASPCEFQVYRGRLLGREVTVSVYEPDAGTKLLGPAALNTIYVHQGNIFGIPEHGFEAQSIVKEARSKGVSTGIRYLDGVAALATAEIENAAREGISEKVEVRVKVTKLPSDVNIKIKPVAERYITGRNKRILVKGPTFFGVKANFLS